MDVVNRINKLIERYKEKYGREPNSILMPVKTINEILIDDNAPIVLIANDNKTCNIMGLLVIPIENGSMRVFRRVVL